MSYQFSDSRAFTLIELLVVISIIALLGGLGHAAYSSVLGKAQTATEINAAKTLAAAYQAAAADHGGRFLPAYDPQAKGLKNADGKPIMDLAAKEYVFRLAPYFNFAVEDTLTPNRLVVGVANDRAEVILKEVYKPVIDLGTPWIRADLPTAELVKVAANSFLATKISFINAMAEVCEAAGGDVTVLAKAIGYDPRIGSRFLQAGIGFGGGCLPKDIRAFMARAQELGADQALEFLREIDAINLRARQRVIDVVRADLSEDLTQYKIAVLGATFKPDSDDVRDSPALDIAAQLQAAGAQVVVHDPKGIEPARKRFPNLDYQEKVADAVKGADAILHLTEWKEYRELDPSVIGQLVKSKFLIDGRNALDRNLWRAAGWRVHALGRTD